jgi:hypothetical protein
MALADWDPRLMSPERALHLAGDWPVYYTAGKAELFQFGSQPDQIQLNQRCGKCHQSITALLQVTDVPDLVGLKSPETTTADQLSDVLRHLVTAHDIPLSGAPDGH